MSRIAPVVSANTETKVAAAHSQLETSLARERRELLPFKRMTDEQIASVIRYLDPDPGSERSGDDGTVLVICFSLVILPIGALAIIWLYLLTY